MNFRDSKFLSLVICLCILASCSKSATTQTPTNTGSDTKQAEDQLLEDINQVIDSVESGSISESGSQIPAPAPSASTGSEFSPAVKVGEPSDLLKNTPGLTPDTKVESKTLKLNQSYQSPGGKDEVEFSIALDGKVIRSVGVKTIKASDISAKFQKGFADAINIAVAAKTVDEAKKIATIAGASLTTQAFIDALKKM